MENMTHTESTEEENSIDFEKIFKKISDSIGIPFTIIKKTIDLLLDGNTVPFIARYRKEVTKGLNEEQIRTIKKNYERLLSLEERKLTVIRKIQSQGKLTGELKERILGAETLQEVEDLYLPYKTRIKTLGAKAIEKGLLPLAQILMRGKIDEEIQEHLTKAGIVIPDESIKKGEVEGISRYFINEEKGVKNEKEALSGALDIIAEQIGNDTEARNISRSFIFKETIISSSVNDEILEENKEVRNSEGKVIDPYTFETYFDFTSPALSLKPHQILALNRAEDLDIISLEFKVPDDNIIHELQKHFLKDQTQATNPYYEYYKQAIELGYKRYIVRSIKRELWRSLREKAEDHAIKVFAKNLKNLLMTPPLKGKAIIGIDPGYRTGCKVAVIDRYGNYLDDSVIYPVPPQNKIKEAKQIMLDLSETHHAFTIAIGNGTASRETELFIADFIAEYRREDRPYEYAIVNEAGASVYSASEIAREEFPDLDVTVRGAISIARRLQDPLSELIKIDPKSIGVGMYQHDVNQTRLKEELDAVIEDCVNSVGVDVNTASSKLLEHVSGLTPSISRHIIEYRKEHGAFSSRDELLKVKGLGPKTFQQCAGFLKIRNAKNPFDSMFIHPEDYDLADKLLKDLGIKPIDLLDKKKREEVSEKLLHIKPRSSSQKYGVTPDKIRYLVEQLRKPDLDPREALDPPILKKEVLTIDDLKEGMIIKGVVRNVVDFGAFVDIGVKINGLVHKSQISNRFVKNVHDFLSVGDIKRFRIIKVDKNRKRIQLSLKKVPQEEVEKQGNEEEG